MERKVFIVSRDRPEILESLRRAVSGERGVEVVLDRRLSDEASSRSQAERRVGPDIDAELKERGFAVVRLAPPAQWLRNPPPRTSRFRF